MNNNVLTNENRGRSYKQFNPVKKIKRKKMSQNQFGCQKKVVFERKDHMSNLKHFINVLTNHRKGSQYYIEDNDPLNVVKKDK